jgi:uncharacterized membrane protein
MLIYALRGVLWNIFLAAVPVALGYWAASLAVKSRTKRALYLPFGLVLLAWLAFLPNTCYLLTEWRHFLTTLDGANLYLRSQNDRSALVFLAMYTAFYFCYSALGMLAFTLALRPLARIAHHFVPNTWIAGVPMFVLLSLGVYLGLVLRDNTWDILTRPGKVWLDIVNVGGHPFLIAVILGFGLFLWLAYLAIDIWVDAIIIRWYLYQVKRGGPR